MIDLAPLFGPKGSVDSLDIDFRVFPRKGPERWLLEARYRKPWHLKTWPRANFRAKVINHVAWGLANIGLHLPSRRVVLPVAATCVYAELRTKFDHLGVFLGTPGPNRKVVVFAENRDLSVFVKVPLGPTSLALAQNETLALTELAQDPDLAQLVPKCHLISGHLAIENIEAKGTGYGSLEDSELARIHSLLFERSKISIPLHELRKTWERSDQSDLPIADLPPEHKALIQSTRTAGLAFLDMLPPDTPIDCYKAHGDFTRWNVLRAEDGTARIIDWELYGIKPRGFDLLHYLTAQGLLVERILAPALLDQLKGMRRAGPGYLPEGALGGRYIGLYLASQALYYSHIFERQDQLHIQAIWQMDAWQACLRCLTRGQGVVTQPEAI